MFGFSLLKEYNFLSHDPLRMGDEDLGTVDGTSKKCATVLRVYSAAPLSVLLV